MGKYSSRAESGEKREEPDDQKAVGDLERDIPMGRWSGSQVRLGGMEVEIANVDNSLPSFECEWQEKVEGHGNPLQYSCLENPMDGGAWRATSPQGPKESDTPEQLTWGRRKIGQYQREITLKEWEELDHGAVRLAEPCSKESLKQHRRGTVGMRAGSGVRFPGLRTRPQLCHWPALSVFPPLVWGNGDQRPCPLEQP